jgi:hypothetical protein
MAITHPNAKVDDRKYLKIRPLSYPLDPLIRDAIKAVEDDIWDPNIEQDVEAVLSDNASLILKISRNLERNPNLTDSLRALITTRTKRIYKHYLYKVFSGVVTTEKLYRLTEHAIEGKEKEIEILNKDIADCNKKVTELKKRIGDLEQQKQDLEKAKEKKEVQDTKKRR